LGFNQTYIDSDVYCVNSLFSKLLTSEDGDDDERLSKDRNNWFDDLKSRFNQSSFSAQFIVFLVICVLYMTRARKITVILAVIFVSLQKYKFVTFGIRTIYDEY
jgi:hypothetical protein